MLRRRRLTTAFPPLCTLDAFWSPVEIEARKSLPPGCCDDRGRGGMLAGEERAIAPHIPTPIEGPVPEGPTPIEGPVPEGPTPIEGPVPEGPTPIEGPVPEGPTPIEGPVP